MSKWDPPPGLAASLIPLIDEMFGTDFLISTARLAKGLSKTPRVLKRAGDRGHLPYRLKGKRRVYAKEDVAEYLSERRTARKKARRKVRLTTLTGGKRNLAKHGFVYFMRAGDFIKIGFTRSMAHRRPNIQTSVPYELELPLQVPGTVDLERRLHTQFAHLRERGEWFRTANELLVVIDQMREDQESRPGIVPEFPSVIENSPVTS